MTTLTRNQALVLANNAGFRGQAANIIVAIAQAESGLRDNATNTVGNTPPSTDRGILQINSYWHPEVSDACAFNAMCSFQQAYRISGGGTSFSQWATYNGGQYKKYLGEGGDPAIIPPPVAGAIEKLNPLAGLSWLGSPARVVKLLAGLGLIAAAVGGVLLAGGGPAGIAAKAASSAVKAASS